MNARLLIVDDSAIDRLIISNILSDCEFFLACDGIEAMDVLHERKIELVILDINMPRMNGFEVLEIMRKDPVLCEIPVIILTNYDETENEIRGLDLGAVDYVRKPLNLESLRKRIEVHVHIRQSQEKINAQKEALEEIVLGRTKELILTRDITIHALISLLEVRNIESSDHCKRIQSMVRRFSEHLSLMPEYCDVLTKEYIDELFKTSPLHDLGKVGIPDNILLKPGKLDHDEFEIMKRHTTFGVEALSYELITETPPSFIKTAIELAATHHERYDGTGYPSGLRGDDIPLSGRILAIIDVYDALTSKRVYKDAIGHHDALEIILDEKGTHFDPRLVELFMEIEKQILEISQSFAQN